MENFDNDDNCKENKKSNIDTLQFRNSLHSSLFNKTINSIIDNINNYNKTLTNKILNEFREEIQKEYNISISKNILDKYINYKSSKENIDNNNTPSDLDKKDKKKSIVKKKKIVKRKIKTVIETKLINTIDSESILKENEAVPKENTLKESLEHVSEDCQNKTTQKKKKIVKKKKIISDYVKFVNFCNRNNYEYFKHKNIYNWSGPAIITNEFNGPTLKEIIDSIEINIKNDICGRNFIIYPEKFEDSSKIEYPYKQLELNDDTDDEELIVVEWEYKGETYFCDENSNKIYNLDSEYLGKRVLTSNGYKINQ